MPSRGVIGKMAETRSIDWCIQNFPSLSRGPSDYYESPAFRFCGGRWFLRLFPNRTGGARNSDTGGVDIGIFRNDGGPPKSFRIAVGIRGSRGVEMEREVVKEFSDDDWYYDWDGFCSRSELINHRSRLMPDDRLTITCVLKCVGSGASGGEQSSDGCVICCEESADCALYRCGHTCMCYKCAFKLMTFNSSAQCPICRHSIQDVIKIYK